MGSNAAKRTVVGSVTVPRSPVELGRVAQWDSARFTRDKLSSAERPRSLEIAARFARRAFVEMVANVGQYRGIVAVAGGLLPLSLSRCPLEASARRAARDVSSVCEGFREHREALWGTSRTMRRRVTVPATMVSLVPLARDLRASRPAVNTDGRDETTAFV
jgi:hypothetical protein